MGNNISTSKNNYCLIKTFRRASDFRNYFFDDCLTEGMSPRESVIKWRTNIERNMVEIQKSALKSKRNENLSKLHNFKLEIDKFENNHLLEANQVFNIQKELKSLMPYGEYDNVYDAASAILMSNGGLYYVNNNALRPSDVLFHCRAGRYDISELNKSLGYRDKVKLFYRGLSSTEYRNISPMDRPSKKNSAGLSSKLLTKRFSRIEHFRAYLRNNFTLYEDVFGGAEEHDRQHLELVFMQHFKDELELAPPLLDITYDPLVALYFASFTPESKKIGVIYNFSLNDISLTKKLAGADLRAAILPEVTRLVRQRALIFEGIQNGVLECVGPEQLTFKQHDHLKFEDPELGIDDLHLLGDDKVAKRFCKDYAKQFTNQKVPTVLSVTEVPEFEKLLGRVLELAHSLHEQSPNWYPCINQELFERLTNFHLAAKANDKFPDHWKTWRNLEGAIICIARGGRIGPNDYYPRLSLEPYKKRKSFYDLWHSHYEIKAPTRKTNS
ncbi:FRG domain-containing protein [Vibrio natriegens]|uniref:FRG domain-containing protein n=1 Tax=Vibrio natriegens TaxID=691 RepID=UPI00390C084B